MATDIPGYYDVGVVDVVSSCSVPSLYSFNNRTGVKKFKNKLNSHWKNFNDILIYARPLLLITGLLMIFVLHVTMIAVSSEHIFTNAKLGEDPTSSRMDVTYCAG